MWTRPPLAIPDSVFALAATCLQLSCFAVVHLASQHDTGEHAAYSRIYGARHPMAATGVTIPTRKGLPGPTPNIQQGTHRKTLQGPEAARPAPRTARSPRDPTGTSTVVLRRRLPNLKGMRQSKPPIPRPETPRGPTARHRNGAQIAASGSNSQRGDSSIENDCHR